MRRTTSRATGSRVELPKSPTGIDGLDQITGGGLPRGRPTLVSGGAGCGKTLFAVEFLVRGATQFGEPGVFVAFEETAAELAANVRSLGFDLDVLETKKKLVVEHVHVGAGEFSENGEYDLEGLFIRLRYAIDQVGAKRIALDTLEMLFGGLQNEAMLRAELQRLFRWLKEQGLTAVITAERGGGALTRHGLEEYVSDCVIVLDHRVIDQVSTRRLRIVKYRGSAHGTNEYPFLIDESGFSVVPITAQTLEQPASQERISTGIVDLDRMLGGAGPHRGTAILISGTAGTGKSSIAAHFAEASVRRRERCLYFAFEESVSQIVRNMRSIGLDLAPGIKKGLLRFVAGRPTLGGLEMHLATMYRVVRELEPKLVVIDPISNLADAGTLRDAAAVLTRLLDFLKSQGISVVFTSLTPGGASHEATEIGVSSVIDTWLLLRDIEIGGERNRGIYVLKSRGTAHSNQIREFLLSDRGVRLLPVYAGLGGVLTGSMRLAQEAREEQDELERRAQFEAKRRSVERKQRALEARIASLRAELEEESAELQAAAQREAARVRRSDDERRSMVESRHGEPVRPRRATNGKQGARP